jgi:hypothetical protein
MLDRAFAEYIARKVGIAVVSDSSSYSGSTASRSDLSAWAGQGTTRVRISFGKGEQTLHEAARRLRCLTATLLETP